LRASASSDPDFDRQLFGAAVASMTARLVSKAGTHAQPERYGELVAELLLPDVIPFNPQRTALLPLPDTRDSFPHLAPARPLPGPDAGAGPAIPKRNPG
jgi:hypothetical protein